LLLCAATNAAVPLQGETTLVVTNYSGTTGGITATIGGQTIDTGTLSYTLDPSHSGNDNFWTYDWDTKEASLQLYLAVTSPTLTGYGISPIFLTINESGTFADAPLVTPGQDNDVPLPAITAFGGGTVQSGPFAGFVFANFNDWTININNSGNNNGTGNGNNLNIKVDTSGKAGAPNPPGQKKNFTSEHSGTITDPTGYSWQSNGAGVGVAGAVPEPDVWCLLLVGFFMVGLALRAMPSARFRQPTSDSV